MKIVKILKITNKLLFALTLVFLQCTLIKGEKIAIYHFNDLGGQLQPIRPSYDPKTGGPVIPCDGGITQECIGGMTNLVYQLQQPSPVQVARTVRISAGNLIGGESGWLAYSSWETYGKFISQYYGNVTGLQNTAFYQTYGLKEFESGLNRTLHYFNQHSASKPLISNVVCQKGADWEVQFCKDAIDKGEVRLTAAVGLVGFITPNAQYLSSPGSWEFNGIVDTLKTVTANSSHKSFIAVGDGSPTIAKQILDQVPKVKVVIYSRALVPAEDMTGNYPVKYKDGYIATAGRYGTSMGRLILDINEDTGAITVDSANSQLITTQRHPNSTDIEEVGLIQTKITENNGPIATSVFALEGGEKCWRDECNLGNLMADSVVHCAYNRTEASEPIIGIWHGGALFSDKVNRSAVVRPLDVHKWLPYHNRAYLASITGENLLKVFAISGQGIKAAENSDYRDWGQFLQVSNGLEVYYATDGNNKVTVDNVRIFDEDEDKPRMKDLEPSKTYRVVVPSFIIEGRSVYGSMKTYWNNTRDIGFDDDCLHNYIKGLEKITVGFEERIYINEPGCHSKTIVEKAGSKVLTVFLTIIFFSIFLAVVYVGYFYIYPKLVGVGRQPGPGGFDNFNNSY